ncbi:MAG TPA: TMEM175 family protein [Ramlibacter sp.]|uniref:TMEM175 family protein n=1 Tax=Ramlibacter sp. TaxID=1917967 RepID=UPI002C8EA090|nr:TMEM175 family protein [Ramlibacter sp.]HVZ46924.1 TMEM175 family protein [Ramlibacter sp.]
MSKSRLEAFSDGVIAIILTIMVLELKVPKEDTVEALAALWPIYAAYALSYWFVFQVWLNHHDTFERLAQVDRSILHCNGLVLFAASFIPFATAYAGEAHWRSTLPVALYGLVMCAVSLAIARLRTLAGRLAQVREDRDIHRLESKKSLWFAGLFVLCAGVALVMPRLSLLTFAITPVIGRMHGRARRMLVGNGKPS